MAQNSIVLKAASRGTGKQGGLGVRQDLRARATTPGRRRALNVWIQRETDGVVVGQAHSAFTPTRFERGMRTTSFD